MTRTPRALAGVVLALSLTACGSSPGPVKSSRSLDELGAQLAKDGEAAGLYLAGSATATLAPATDDASSDVACDDGKRRTYRTSFTGSTAVVGGDRAEADVRNTEGLAAQIAFKRIGYGLTSDVDKSSNELPATLEFANDPESADQERTFRTTVEVGGEAFTVTITGETACIAG